MQNTNFVQGPAILYLSRYIYFSRFEGRGNGKVDYDEFVTAIEPIIVKMHDIHEE